MSLIRTKHIQHLSPAERALYKWINKKHKNGYVCIRLLPSMIGSNMDYWYYMDTYIQHYFNNEKPTQQQQQWKYRSRRNQW